MDDGKGKVIAQSLLNQPTRNSPCDLSFPSSKGHTVRWGDVLTEGWFVPRNGESTSFGTRFLSVCVFTLSVWCFHEDLFFFSLFPCNIYVYMFVCILLVLITYRSFSYLLYVCISMCL